MKKRVVAGLTILAICTAIILLRPYLWFRVRRAKVACEGRALPGSRVYKNSTGALLVTLGAPYGRSYLIQPTDHIVGIPARDFWLKTAVVFGTSQAPLEFVALGSPKTDSPDPKLRLGSNTAEFFDYDGRPVRVAW
jgi:hypothetical protein